jgi:hypothetical protein
MSDWCAVVAAAQVDAAASMVGLLQGSKQQPFKECLPSAAPTGPAVTAGGMGDAAMSLQLHYLTHFCEQQVAHAHGVYDYAASREQQVQQLHLALHAYDDEQAPADQQRCWEQPLHLLVQCALLGVVPAPDKYAQLWAALEPHVNSLEPEQLAEVMWANSVVNSVSYRGCHVWFSHVWHCLPACLLDSHPCSLYCGTL